MDFGQPRSQKNETEAIVGQSTHDDTYARIRLTGFVAKCIVTTVHDVARLRSRRKLLESQCCTLVEKI